MRNHLKADMKKSYPVVAILEDDEGRIGAMRRQLEISVPWVSISVFDNAPDMLLWLQDNLVSVALLSLDHDLGPNRKHEGKVFDPGTGRDVVEYLCTRKPTCPVLIHSSNSTAAQGMHFALTDAGWENKRVFPLGDIEWIIKKWSSEIRELLHVR